MDNIEATLKGGSGDIRVKIHVSSSAVTVTYRGFPTDLLDCGAIESSMVPKSTKGQKRYDSHGDLYRRRMFKNGSIEVERFVTSFDRARSLPGVPAYISDPIIYWLDCNPGKIHTERHLTIDGKHAWVHCYGTRQAIETAGLKGTWQEIMHGYYEVFWCEPVVAEWPFHFAFSQEAFNQLGLYEKAFLHGDARICLH